MGFNQVENAFLAEAIANLKPQYESVYGPLDGNFYIGKGVKFIIIDEGINKGKLTIGKTIDGKVVPDPQIKPVDCYNHIMPGECLAEAVNRVFLPSVYVHQATSVQY